MWVCVQLVGGQFEMESNFVINDPDTIVQMLTLMDSCSLTLQASNLTISERNSLAVSCYFCP